MLTIRAEQLRAFERPPGVEESVAHLREHFPVPTTLAGDPAVGETVRASAERARELGLTTRRAVLQLLDLRVMLGSGFDCDPQLPWARQATERRGAALPDEVMAEVFARATTYLDAVVGPGGVFPVLALRRMLEYPMSALRECATRGLEPVMAAELQRVWPEKVEAIGVAPRARLVQEAIARGREHGLRRPEHLGYYALVMFLLGHAFDRDPMYPWARAALASGPASEARFEAFHRTTQELLARVFSGETSPRGVS